MEKSLTKQDLFVDEQLKRFEVKEEDLKELAAKYSAITIKDVDDKEGYQLASTSRKLLKSKRVEIQKIGKELRSVANAFNKAVIEREDALVGIIEPVERALQKQEDDIDEERDRIRIEQERLEDERIQKMIDSFSAVGAAVDYIEIKGMTQEQYDQRLEEASLAFTKKLAEEKAEREKLEAERMEEERVRRIREKEEEEARKKRDEELEKERIRLKEIEDEQVKRDFKLRKEREAFEREKREHEEKVRKEDEGKKRLLELEEAKKRAAEEALEAKAKKDEADRLKKIEEDRIAEERRQEELNEAPDREKFSAMYKQVYDLWNDSLWGKFKSKAGIKTAKEANDILKQALDLLGSKLKK